MERETPDYVRNRLNKRLFDKVNAIEMKREEEQREAARSAKMTKEEKRQMRLKKRQQELKVRPLNCLLIMEHLYEETSATTCFDEIGTSNVSIFFDKMSRR